MFGQTLFKNRTLVSWNQFCFYLHAMFQNDIQLASYTTFGIPAKAKLFAEIYNLDELFSIWKSREYNSTNNKLILGGGSNMLFTKDFDGLVLHNKITGISFEDESEQSVIVKSGAGENWHELVLKCVENNLGGFENLSLIPGTVGASPVQNIGAYGVELKDSFVSLEAFDFETGQIVHFNNEECEFGYRDSIFKNEAKGRYFISSVNFRLKKPGFHKLNMSYGAVGHTLQEMEVSLPTIKDISDAIVSIRSSKLPDPKVIGNAGSFFKNPEVEESFCQLLLNEYPLMPTYSTHNEGFRKIAAGWLIEQCGWKGKSLGNAAVHKNQALVLTNPGNASGQEVKNLAEEIQKSVFQKFGVKLETEVNII